MSSSAGPRLVGRGLSKRYGQTRALTDCGIDLHAGEIHAVMGENGSGKSTLVKLLSGVQRPDAGSITLDGTEVHLRRPRDAITNGVATVFQDVLVSPNRSLLENIWMGVDGVLRTRAVPGGRRRVAGEVLERLLDNYDLDRPVGELSLSDRQVACIARALVREPRVLILDEATSALDIAARNRLFEVLSGLRDAGCAVLFISHRMDEVELIADRATVLRSGRTVAELPRGAVEASQLIRLMTGSSQLVQERASQEANRTDEPLQVALTIRQLQLRPDTEPINLMVRKGEVLGLAGLEGQGQDLFLRVLAGLRTPSDGTVVGESGIPVTSGRSAAEQGICYLPRDRQRESILPGRSIADNFALPTAAADRRRGLLSRKAARSRFRRYVDPLRIALTTAAAPIDALSGGNQQKVVLARWLAAQPRVLLLNDPTRGVDIGSKRDIYRILRDLATSGIAIVMLSTELDELVEFMDSIVVFREHSVHAVHAGDGISHEDIVRSYFGREAP